MCIWGDKRSFSLLTLKVVTHCFLPSSTLVKRLFRRPGECDTQFIKANFLPMGVDKILSIHLVGGGSGDVIVLHYSKDENYNVKSGYWLCKKWGSGTGSCGEKNESNTLTPLMFGVIFETMNSEQS